MLNTRFKQLLSLFTALFICLFMISPLSAASTYVKDIEMDVYINESGQATINETWDMVVNKGTEVYKIFNNMGGKTLTLVNVEDESGRKYINVGNWDVDLSKSQKDYKCGLIDDDGHYELCFGIGEYGKHQYTFTYTIDNFVNQYSDLQGINYAFISDMSLKVDRVSIDMSSYYEYNYDNSKIWGYGYYGECNYLDNGHVELITSEALNNDKMQLVMEIEDGRYTSTHKVDDSFEHVSEQAMDGSSFDEESSEESSAFTFLLIFGSIIFQALIWIAVIFGIRHSSNRRFKLKYNDNIAFKAKNVMPFREIPCNKDILYFYFVGLRNGIIKEDDRSGLISAFILKWIKNGEIEFVKEEDTGFLMFKKEGYSIDFNRNITTDSKLEADLLGMIKKACGANLILETKEFEKWATRNYKQLEKWYKDVEKTVKNDLGSRGLCIQKGTQKENLPFSDNKSVYDASIREDAERIYGLKLFLEEQNNIKEKEVIEVHLWDEYLIFATILGIADVVEKQLDIVCPQYREMSTIDIYYASRITRHFVYVGVQRSHDQAQLANASSGASSGGGGFSSFSGGGGGFSGGGGGGVR